MVLLSIHNTSDIYGASQSLRTMLRLFVRDGHTVHVVLPGAGPLVQLMEADGITVHVFPAMAIVDRSALGSMGGKLSFLFRYPWSVCWLMLRIVRLKVDVVHTNTAVLPAPALAARLTGRRHIWHIREFFSEFQQIWRFFQRYMYGFSDRIITISNAVRDQFDPEYRDKCVVIYNGLGPEATAVDREQAKDFRSAWGNPSLLIGVVGRIKWVRKGQEVLVKAAALLADRFPKARYAIVGSVSQGNDDHLARLRQLVDEKGLAERVIFTGDIRNARDVYAAFDINVVPSVLPEPFGRVVMESMAAGTPVVGSRCGGIPEQMVDGVSGILFEPGDEEDLARALARLIEDPTLRRAMSEAGKHYVREKFDDSVVYAQVAALFAAVAQVERA